MCSGFVNPEISGVAFFAGEIARLPPCSLSAETALILAVLSSAYAGDSAVNTELAKIHRKRLNLVTEKSPFVEVVA